MSDAITNKTTIATQTQQLAKKNHTVLDDDQSQLMRATQSVRANASLLSPALLSGMVVALYINHAGELSNLSMIGWGLCLLAATAFTLITNFAIARTVDHADRKQLIKNERWLIATTATSNLAVGSCYWWLASPDALVGTSELPETNIAFTLLMFCSVYALNSLKDSSIQFNAFVIGVVLNLGQCGVFFLGATGLFEPIISMGLVIFAFLLAGFSRENTDQFTSGVRMQGENLSLLDQLNSEKDTVDNALENAEVANDTKSQFLAAASHDLRQPLYALSLYLGSLEQVVGSGKGREIIDKMNDTTAFLNDQFNSLLDLAQFDAGAIAIRPSTFQLTPLLERLLASFTSQAEEKALRLTLTSEDVYVETDRQLLERVLRNLLENAVRYTQKGEITIKVTTVRDQCTVAIEDTGSGISPADQTKIFDDFVQVGNQARNQAQGVGLGLAIVSRICSLLEYPLNLESEPNKGSVFSITVPICLAPETTNTYLAESETEAISGTRVWVLDDNVEIREALKMQLESWNCEVTVLTCEQDLKEARQAQLSWPDLLMLDDMLDDAASGLDIARTLVGGALAEGALVDGIEATRMEVERIALITGNTQGGRLKEIGKSGFQCLLKPVATSELRNLIASAGRRP